MGRILSLGGLVISMTFTWGCATVDEFALPQGDADAGRAAFISIGCTACHSAAGADHEPQSGSGINFPLGGSVQYEKTYVELVTSIINPSHRIVRAYAPTSDVIGGREVSKMRVFNDVMTVGQLADIVTYLAPQYRIAVVPYEYREYPYPYRY